ncbi:hypothetical protein KFE25_008692 [Diacronema lutheri]|uniref:Uncharacterized protein n=2 Tax=Diacronema lutheri TaxID=2081491 RepID=A0A8J6CGM8_DIALT|nr:hypothetical protein KFE25_008692 [Diacronema lutheri]
MADVDVGVDFGESFRRRPEQPSRSSACPAGPTYGHDEPFLISPDEARYAMATLTIIRVARARVSLRLADVLARWRVNLRAVLLDKLVRKQLVPLLTSRSSMINTYRPSPEEYVAFGEEERTPPSSAPRAPVPMSGKVPDGSAHRFALALLRDELQHAESSLADAKPQVGHDGTDSRDWSDDTSLRLELESATSSVPYAPGGVQLDALSLAASPAAPRGSGVRSPTPTDMSESGTSLPTPARLSRGHAGLTLKQLSEGNRALNAAVERELRRAAELAKVKQRHERSEMRLNRAQQQLQTALAELEELRAQLKVLRA